DACRRNEFERAPQEPSISGLDFRSGRGCTASSGVEPTDSSVRILAIRLARFGDIVLLLPALTWLKTQLPQSHLTFLTDIRWKPLAEMCPAIDSVIGLDRLEMRYGSRWDAFTQIRDLGQILKQGRFDVALDCHGFRETALMAWWSGAPRRLGLKRFD